MNGIAPPLVVLSPEVIEEEALSLRKRGLYDQDIAERLGVPYVKVKLAFDRLRKRGVDVPLSPYHNRNRTQRQYDIEDCGYKSACWVWRFAKDRNGYGILHERGEVLAHRVYFLRRHGVIPVGFELHHLCEKPSCVNPDHLVLVSRADHQVAHRLHERRRVVQDVAKIRAIRELRKRGGTLDGIGRLFGISPQTVTRIVRREGGYTDVD